MNTLIGLFTLLLTALVLENAIFSRALDVTALLVIPFGKKGIWLFGLILTGITATASLIAGILNPVMSSWENVQYLRPVVYIVVLAALYGVTCLVLNWRKKDWFHDYNTVLTMAFFNCAVYGAMALTVYSGFNWLESLVYGLGLGLSFLLAAFLLEQGRRCMGICNIPKAFRGLPAELVYVGLVSLSLYGLVGHQLAA
ncbi:MAG: Rnf-Nqr domain containing protein [Oscillospiraceae bacterium]|nr:Rnf-Nqr domain containing protein [Oscillospiraceae bacterium]